MKHYTIAELDITDHSWVREYARTVTNMVESAGGRYLARTARIQKLEGQRPIPQVLLIIEWPSREVADAFYVSEAYRPYRRRRVEGARSEIVLVAGEDIAKQARLLD